VRGRGSPGTWPAATSPRRSRNGATGERQAGHFRRRDRER